MVRQCELFHDNHCHRRFCATQRLAAAFPLAADRIHRHTVPVSLRHQLRAALHCHVQTQTQGSALQFRVQAIFKRHRHFHHVDNVSAHHIQRLQPRTSLQKRPFPGGVVHYHHRTVQRRRRTVASPHMGDTRTLHVCRLLCGKHQRRLQVHKGCDGAEGDAQRVQAHTASKCGAADKGERAACATRQDTLADVFFCSKRDNVYHRGNADDCDRHRPYKCHNDIVELREQRGTDTRYRHRTGHVVVVAARDNKMGVFTAHAHGTS